MGRFSRLLLLSLTLHGTLLLLPPPDMEKAAPSRPMRVTLIRNALSSAEPVADRSREEHPASPIKEPDPPMRQPTPSPPLHSPPVPVQQESPAVDQPETPAERVLIAPRQRKIGRVGPVAGRHMPSHEALAEAKPEFEPDREPAAEVTHSMEAAVPGAAPETWATARESSLAATSIEGLPDRQVFADYLAALRARIEQQKRYPLVARKREKQGEVGLRFLLDAHGQARELTIQKSSGHESLDRAALEAVRKALPFAKPPAGFITEPLLMELTVVFKLGL